MPEPPSPRTAARKLQTRSPGAVITRSEAELLDQKRRAKKSEYNRRYRLRCRRRALTCWDAELLDEKRRTKRSLYNRTYRSRHPQRERHCQPIYKARWVAKQSGLEPPPLPNWHRITSDFEVSFARGPRPGSGGRPPKGLSRKLLSSSSERLIYSKDNATPPRGASIGSVKGRPEQLLNRRTNDQIESTMSSRRYPEVGRISKQCRLCGRTFRLFKSRIVHPGDGSFCSIHCRSMAWNLFSLALATEQLEPIFKALAAALKEKDQKKVQYE
jgi:hypothetical protein